MLIKVTDVEAIGPHRLRVAFSDGSHGDIDMRKDIMSRTGPVVEPLRDPKFFSQVIVDYGAPTWPNGYDICPVTLYDRMREAGLLQPPDVAA